MGSTAPTQPRRPLTITRWNGTNGFNGCHGEQGRSQESHGRSAGSAGVSMLQTPTRTGRLLSIGGAHTWQLSLLDLPQAMKSLQLCQLQASENGPDTTERAPLDARVWVPSVFRARPAIKMQECPLSLFRARTGRRRRRGPTRREEACAQRVYATNSLPRKSKKPSRGAPPACGPAAATRWTPGKGRGRRKRVPPAKTGSDEPRCTLASHNARSASGAAPSGTEPLEHTKDTIKQVRGPAPAQGTRAHSAG